MPKGCTASSSVSGARSEPPILVWYVSRPPYWKSDERASKITAAAPADHWSRPSASSVAVGTPSKGPTP
jgi:hypothetical protein